MPHYLLANYLPDNFDPSTVTAATVQAINDLNDELEAAGARLMACGLSPASQAKSVRGQPNGEALIHRRSLSGSQGAHWRLLDPGSR